MTNFYIKGPHLDPAHYNGGLAGYVRFAEIKDVAVTGYINARNYTGGLIGKMYQTRIERCKADINIIVGTVNENGRWIGGLVGYSSVGMNPAYSEIAECYATGSINYELMAENVGGLVGQQTSWGHDDQLFRPIITDSYSTVNVSGTNDVGGLVGFNFDGAIINSYSTGEVKGDDRIGGMVGSNIDGFVINSYWDGESSGMQESSVGALMTTVKMMQTNSFNNWDFNNTWAISEWYNEDPFPSYPYLRWEGEDPQNPVPSEHNRPINFDPYFGEDGREFYVNHNRYFWVSFPWLSRDVDDVNFIYPRQTFEEAIKPLEAKVDSVGHWNVIDSEGLNAFTQEMRWNDLQELYIGDLPNFCSIRGYKIRFDDDEDEVPPGLYRLPTYGTLIDPMTSIPVYEVAQGPNENWVGIFLPSTLVLPDALGPHEEDFFETIQTHWGTMVWENDQWNQSMTVQYGEMVKLTLLNGVGSQVIHWLDMRTQGRSYTPPEHTPKPVARHFPIIYGPSFESLFIEDISFDEDIVEIGVYVDGECVGASVFEGKYPTEVLAYTNESHINDNLTVVLYLEDNSYVKYNDFPVRELGSRGYSGQTIRPLQSKFTFFKIDRTGGERSLAVEDESKEEDVPQPVFGLSQNYPNPFSLKPGVRGQGQTSISLSLPRDMPVSLNIYNIKGQLVRTLISGETNRGEHTVNWNGKDNNNNIVSSGIYFYRLETPEKTINRKMLIVR